MSASSVRAFRRHSERQFAITAQFMPPHDPLEIEAFAAAMSGFEGMDRRMQRFIPVACSWTSLFTPMRRR